MLLQRMLGGKQRRLINKSCSVRPTNSMPIQSGLVREDRHKSNNHNDAVRQAEISTANSYDQYQMQHQHRLDKSASRYQTPTPSSGQYPFFHRILLFVVLSSVLFTDLVSFFPSLSSSFYYYAEPYAHSTHYADQMHHQSTYDSSSSSNYHQSTSSHQSNHHPSSSSHPPPYADDRDRLYTSSASTSAYPSRSQEDDAHRSYSYRDNRSQDRSFDWERETTRERQRRLELEDDNRRRDLSREAERRREDPYRGRERDCPSSLPPVDSTNRSHRGSPSARANKPEEQSIKEARTLEKVDPAAINRCYRGKTFVPHPEPKSFIKDAAAQIRERDQRRGTTPNTARDGRDATPNTERGRDSTSNNHLNDHTRSRRSPSISRTSSVAPSSQNRRRPSSSSGSVAPSSQDQDHRRPSSTIDSPAGRPVDASSAQNQSWDRANRLPPRSGSNLIPVEPVVRNTPVKESSSSAREPFTSPASNRQQLERLRE